MKKIDKNDLNKYRIQDTARLALNYLWVINCPGGRPIVDGYICPHCGIDASQGECAGVEGFVKSDPQSY